MPADTAIEAPRSPLARSGVTNESRLFVEGDGRSAWARRYRDLVEIHVADLGGPERLSEAQRALIRRAVALTIECERREGRLSAGQDEDLGVYVTAANALRRILVTLGLERRARDVTPRFKDYLDSRVKGAKP
jgi:hypothetical protein